jgi:hypothetical protein
VILTFASGAVAARKIGVRGRRPRLSAQQAEVAQQLYDGGKDTVQQIADMFGVPRSTRQRRGLAVAGRRVRRAARTGAGRVGCRRHATVCVVRGRHGSCLLVS